MRAAEGKPHRPYATEREAIERMRRLGAEIVTNTPQEFAAFLKADIDKWQFVPTPATNLVCNRGLTVN